jgi:hypothetical protein
LRFPKLLTPAVLALFAVLALAGAATAADGTADSTGFGQYSPTGGFRVASTKDGDLNIRLYTYIRYLNQMRLDEEFTDSFGNVKTVQRRQDIQVNKMQVYFFGWIMSRQLRYTMYIWTSNTSLGQTSQLVFAGNINYKFDPRATLGFGIAPLPGVRSTEGNFPYWLAVDSRLATDEFMRPSYTTGLWLNGDLAPRLTYQAMVGNNLSQFGIDAGQLDNTLDTYSGSLVWKPTTGEFGKAGAYGDYDEHDRLATRIGAHATSSVESRQGQPTTDAFDNVQIRLSDGNVIFAPNLFAPGVQVDRARYEMLSGDFGLKYRGWSLEGEYYWRGIDNFRTSGSGTMPLARLNDTGFQAQASMMAMPAKLQLYAGVSKVYGQYGEPSDFRVGANLFPYRNQVVRWNFEILQLDHVPAGAYSLPYSVGGNGAVFHSSFMLWF